MTITPADAVREAPTELERIIAEMRAKGAATPAYIEQWADRLAALAGAAPDQWFGEVECSDAKGAWLVLCDVGQDSPIKRGAKVVVTLAGPHAPAKAREDVLLPLLRDMWAETVSHAEMWGQRPDDALRDRYLAALATFAEGAE